MRALITGGAGFIGSHLLERLVSQDVEVTILDNLSSGSKKNIHPSLNKGNAHFMRGDCTQTSDVEEALKDVDTVFHLSANPEVRLELNDPKTCFQQNIYATHILLEAMRRSQIHTIIFTSTSTVYGDAKITPTPETYPTRPISLYGASKLASEALITSYAYTYNWNTLILRLANTVGPRSTHGVLSDFINQLKKDPTTLEILGDGTQTKSYLHIHDCIDALLTALQQTKDQVSILNIGSEDQVNVQDIAKTVVEEMGLQNVTFHFTGGVDGGRGWKGDVKNMLLDVSQIKTLGWRCRYNSADAVRRTIRALLE